jgi:hypothetical protein
MRSPFVNDTDYRRNPAEYASRRMETGEFRGIVVENRDPQVLGRCKVRVYAIHGPEAAIPDRQLPWARPKTDIAGADSGSFDVPEKGARVWVFFEQGDLNYPIYSGGWLVNPSGADPTPPDPNVIAAQRAALAQMKAGNDVTDAAGDIEDAANDAKSAAEGLNKALNTAIERAMALGSAIRSLGSNTSLSRPSGGSGSSLEGEPAPLFQVYVPVDVMREIDNAIIKSKEGYRGLVEARSQAELASGQAADVAARTELLEAESRERCEEVHAQLEAISSEIQDTPHGGSRLILTVEEMKRNCTPLADSVMGLQSNSRQLELACGMTLQAAGTGLNLAGECVRLGDEAKGCLIVTEEEGAEGATLKLDRLADRVDSLADQMSDLLSTKASEATDACSGAGAGAASTASQAKSATKQAKTTKNQLLVKVVKTMGKKEDDPAMYPRRPQPYDDKGWDVGPGAEISRESQQVANNSPTVRTWRKSPKGHTLMCDDQDAKETLQLIDRAGNVLYFDCPVDQKDNAGNKEQRGMRNALSGDALDRSKMRDKGSKVGLQDQAQSKVELDSRKGAEKIIIIANDGDGGVENGRNRQVIRVQSGSNTIDIESIKDGEVNAKVFIDANAGLVIVEAARYVNIDAPYVSINADHINLDGKVNVLGDMTIAGRLTGGES